MMTKIERLQAEELRDRLKNILPDLKLAYENTKQLFSKHNWDISHWEIGEAYMSLAEEYIRVMDAFEEEDRGDAK